MEDPPLPGFYHITGLLKFFVEYCPDESLKYITAQHVYPFSPLQIPQICHYLKLLTYGCMLDFMKILCPYPDEDQDAGGQKYHVRFPPTVVIDRLEKKHTRGASSSSTKSTIYL